MLKISLRMRVCPYFIRYVCGTRSKRSASWCNDTRPLWHDLHSALCWSLRVRSTTRCGVIPDCQRRHFTWKRALQHKRIWMNRRPVLIKKTKIWFIRIDGFLFTHSYKFIFQVSSTNFVFIICPFQIRISSCIIYSDLYMLRCLCIPSLYIYIYIYIC